MRSRKSDVVSEIIPGIFLTNWVGAHETETFTKFRITAVLNCTQDVSFTLNNVQKMRVSIGDHKKFQDIFYNSIPEAMKFMRRNKCVLVHCYAGVSRSASMVAAYLIVYHDMTPDQAINYIISKRPVAFGGGPFQNFRVSLDKLYRLKLQRAMG